MGGPGAVARLRRALCRGGTLHALRAAAPTMHGQRRCTTAASARVTADVAARFARDGFVTPVDVLTPEETGRCLRRFEAYSAHCGGRVSGDARFRTHLLLPWVAALVHHPALVDAACACLGTDTLLAWSSDWNVKAPRSTAFFSLHQDSTYAGLHPATRVVTAWLALTDVSAAAGGIRYVRGSHLWGQLPHTETADEANMLSRGQAVPAAAVRAAHNAAAAAGAGAGAGSGGGAGAGGSAQAAAAAATEVGGAVSVEGPQYVTACLRPGQACIHAFRALHASGPNTLEVPRVGLAIRYMAPEVFKTRAVAPAASHCDVEPSQQPPQQQQSPPPALHQEWATLVRYRGRDAREPGVAEAAAADVARGALSLAFELEPAPRAAMGDAEVAAHAAAMAAENANYFEGASLRSSYHV